MSMPRITSSPRAALALFVAIIAAACGADSTPTDISTLAPSDLRQLLSVAIQDEYHAEAVYAGVLMDFGEVMPFSNIIGAEERHSTALARLYANRGWEAPQSEWAPGNVARFGSVVEACDVGVDAELANIRVYDQLLTEPGLPADVIQVFTSNRAASLERHLPAFQRCGSGV